MEEQISKNKSFKINYKKILLVFLFIVLVLYSFLGWKMTRTSNPFVANPKFIIKSFFTWNPAELVSSVFNRWDTLYLSDKSIMPESNFLDLKKQIEKAINNAIYFEGFLNDITYDEKGGALINRGTFLMEKNGKFTKYDFYIYKNKTKATKTSELDHKAGLVIYKRPQTMTKNDIEESKIFTSATIKVLNTISLETLITKDTKRILLSRGLVSKQNLIITSDKSLKLIRYISFDDNGNIVEDKNDKLKIN